jgi:predicted Zn-dependent peptidase
LFQNVREKLGLAYSIHSYNDRYTDCGMTGIYAACGPGSLDKIWQASLAEMDSLASALVDDRELARAKTQAEDTLRLSYESLDSRLTQITGQMAYHGRIFSMEEILEDIHGVTAENLRTLAGELFGDKSLFSVIVVGPEEARSARLLES